MAEPSKASPKSKSDYAIQVAPSRYNILSKPVSSTDLALKYSLPCTQVKNPSPQTNPSPSRPQTPLSYAKVAKSNYNSKIQPTSLQFQPTSPQPKYIDNPNAELMDKVLEPHQMEEKPSSSKSTYKYPILEKIFPPQFNFYPDSPQKTRIFYEFILVDTDSVEITHIPDQKDKSRIAYSKAKLLKVLSPEDWNQCEWTGKYFSQSFEPSAYNYNDYQKAWYNTFFVRAYDHSWFLFFSPHFKSKLPNWFHIWWKTFGAIPEIFPPQIKSNFDQFNRQSRNPPTCLYFMLHNQIPWILSWWFAIKTLDSIPFLFKRFKLKWWQNFKHSDSPKSSQETLKTEDFPPIESLVGYNPAHFKSKKDFKHAIKLAFQNLSDSEEEGEASTSQLQDNEDQDFGLGFI